MDEKIMIEVDKYVFDKILEYQKEIKSDNISEAIVKAICMAHFAIDNYKKGVN